jgi:hypothetical protein
MPAALVFSPIAKRWGSTAEPGATVFMMPALMDFAGVLGAINDA